MLLLKLDNTKKRWTNKNIIGLDIQTGNKKKYKVEVIRDNVVYIKELKMSYLSRFIILLFRKNI